MKTIIVLFALISITLGCKESKTETVDLSHDDVEVNTSQTVERIFPENYEIQRKDTLVNGYNIKITGEETGTFTTMSYEMDGIEHVDKFRDFKYTVIVEKGNDRIINKTFTKQDFALFEDSDEFLNEANFHGYDFESLSAIEIIFSGYIGVPETDNAFVFQHIYNFDRKEFQIVEKVYVDEYL